MTETQNMQALRLANEIRLTNAVTCKRISEMSQADARREVARLLVEDESRAFEALRIERLLTSVYRFGPATVRSACREIGVQYHGKRIANLTARQRVALAELIANDSARAAA